MSVHIFFNNKSMNHKYMNCEAHIYISIFSDVLNKYSCTQYSALLHNNLSIKVVRKNMLIQQGVFTSKSAKNLHFSNLYCRACALLCRNILYYRVRRINQIYATKTVHLMYIHTSIQGTNRPFRRSGYTGCLRSIQHRNAITLVGPYANTRARFIGRTIKKETMEIANKGDRKYEGTAIQYTCTYNTRV